MLLTSQELLSEINTYISELSFLREPQNLYNPITYELALGGKRLRPVLMLLAYQMYGKSAKHIYSQAAGIEMYHNYTLLHDDLMDNADMRRGKETVHKKWNENTAILSGDAMLVLAYNLISDCDEKYLPKVLKTFSQTALEICEGQQWDMDFESRNDVSVDEYIEMIRLKTSVLLAASLQIGAIMAEAPQEDTELLYRFGEQMGLAFQLQDDYLDVYGDPKVFGKKIGGDILCNKKTYMLITALNRSNEQQRKELSYWLNSPNPNPEEKISAVTAIYNEVGVLALCEQLIAEYFDKALQALQQVRLPEENKEALKHFALNLLKRQN